MPAPESIQDAVRQAAAPLDIIGGNSKRAYLNAAREGTAALDVSAHAGIIEYEPTELVIRARAGTTIEALNAAVGREGQIPGFEPPAFAGRATIGGTIACGISGARRPWYGAARDFVLGVGLVTAAGEYVEFGGQVMKNVAGFDVSRLVCGSLGTLGVIADVSLKTLPAPEREVTMAFALDRHAAHRKMLEISNRSLPVSGLAWFDGTMFVRWSGAGAAVDAARAAFGGDPVDTPPWLALADYSRFSDARRLWRVSVPPASTAFIDEATVIDWGGAQRWLLDPAFDPRARLEAGHATLVIDRTNSGIARAQPLSAPVHAIHRRLKAKLDPDGRFNPGRLYAEV